MHAFDTWAVGMLTDCTSVPVNICQCIQAADPQIAPQLCTLIFPFAFHSLIQSFYFQPWTEATVAVCDGKKKVFLLEKFFLFISDAVYFRSVKNIYK